MSRKRVFSIILVVIIVMAVVGVYMLINPATSHLFPKCIFLKLTGFKCPGCGSQRFFHSLLNGDLRMAAHYNAFLFGAIPIIALYLLSDYTKLIPKWLDKVLKHPVTIALLVITMIIWWITRNIFNW
ncbi:MAG: DUF2752 domain-containing protein [Muribaculaceae bacterium]|nr:DUF2752 domain-containing protein [Muribaculaceae bacterium]MBR0024235.1 DUF2752 domain-containing protein [Muribaculaceae bacterium]